MLYVVGTPLGNLNDLSIRQAKTIAGCEILLCEDTRTTGLLLQKIKELFRFDKHPNQRLMSYYKEKELEKLPIIIDLLRSNKDAALLSQSGLPLISDPGLLLVQQCVKRDIPFAVIPGPTAVATGLIYSGFNPDKFMFCGFLPKKTSQLLQLINRLKSVSQLFPEIAFVFYESAKRIGLTLQLFDRTVPDSDIVICREMTKKFEEIIRGKPKDLLNRYYKGEITLLVRLWRI